MDEEMNKWQAEELEGWGNRRKKNLLKAILSLIQTSPSTLPCTMYLCKVLGTHRHAQTMKEKRSRTKKKKSIFVHLSGIVYF